MNNTIEQRIKDKIREVKDFPKSGIMFKDITPLLKDPMLCSDITDELMHQSIKLKPDAIACLESRGFWFGMLIAQRLQIPFIPIRKLGKLPYETDKFSYSLEYGTATMEVHTDAFKKGQRILIHDDLLATGGTASSAAELIKMQGATVCGFIFLIELSFFAGKENILKYNPDVVSLVSY